MKPPLIVVFLKWPKPGCVKTRLASKVGNAEAVTIYKALVRAVGLRLAQAGSICGDALGEVRGEESEQAREEGAGPQEDSGALVKVG